MGMMQNCRLGGRGRPCGGLLGEEPGTLAGRSGAAACVGACGDGYGGGDKLLQAFAGVGR